MLCRNAILKETRRWSGSAPRLKSLAAEQRALEARLVALNQPQAPLPLPHVSRSFAKAAPVTNASTAAEKIALCRRLFAGRSDVHPVRWENRKAGRSGYAPACANEWVKGICGKPRVKCGECPNQAFMPVSDLIEKHLRGATGSRRGSENFVAGVYPLLLDETCWFLAAHFDGESWSADAIAMMETCDAKGIDSALERSRSGNGGHLWIFFSEPIPACTARQLGSLLVTETMERRPEISFASYDPSFQARTPCRLAGSEISSPFRCSGARGNRATASLSIEICVPMRTSGRVPFHEIGMVRNSVSSG